MDLLPSDILNYIANISGPLCSVNLHQILPFNQKLKFDINEFYNDLIKEPRVFCYYMTEYNLSSEIYYHAIYSKNYNLVNLCIDTFPNIDINNIPEDVIDYFCKTPTKKYLFDLRRYRGCPLMFACSFSNISIINLLLENGFDANLDEIISSSLYFNNYKILYSINNYVLSKSFNLNLKCKSKMFLEKPINNIFPFDKIYKKYMDYYHYIMQFFLSNGDADKLKKYAKVILFNDDYHLIYNVEPLNLRDIILGGPETINICKKMGAYIDNYIFYEGLSIFPLESLQNTVKMFNYLDKNKMMEYSMDNPDVNVLKWIESVF